jgi:hypothetical protein
MKVLGKQTTRYGDSYIADDRSKSLNCFRSKFAHSIPTSRRAGIATLSRAIKGPASVACLWRRLQCIDRSVPRNRVAGERGAMASPAHRRRHRSNGSLGRRILVRRNLLNAAQIGEFAAWTVIVFSRRLNAISIDLYCGCLCSSTCVHSSKRRSHRIRCT